MNLEKQIHKRLLEPRTPLFVFTAGFTFCVVIRILNVCALATYGSHELNHVISKRYCGINYVWFCEAILAGFCVLGLLLFIRSRNKIYRAALVALIASCLSIASNVAFMKAGAKLGHMGLIKEMENAIESADPDPLYISRHKHWYSLFVHMWNEVEEEKYKPLSKAYWDFASRGELDELNTLRFEVAENITNNGAPKALLFCPDGKVIGILPDGTRLFGFAALDDIETNPESAYFFTLNLDFEDSVIDCFASISGSVLKIIYFHIPTFSGGELHFKQTVTNGTEPPTAEESALIKATQQL